MKEKDLPEDAVAVRLKNGNVYHPIWPREGKPGWYTGTCVLGPHVGGTSMFNPPMVGKAFTQNAYDVLRLTWTQAEQEKARLAELQTAKPEPTPDPEPTPLAAPEMEAKPELRQFPVSVHMIVKALTQEDAERFVREKLAEQLCQWFSDDTPGGKPSPEGSLLWYRYATTGVSGNFKD